MLAAIDPTSPWLSFALTILASVAGPIIAGIIFSLAGLPVLRSFLRNLGEEVKQLKADVKDEHDARLNCKVECAQLYVKDGDLGAHARRNDEHFQEIHTEISEGNRRLDTKIDAESKILHKRVTDLAAKVQFHEGQSAQE
jgi:hypothetical protein